MNNEKINIAYNVIHTNNINDFLSLDNTNNAIMLNNKYIHVSGDVIDKKFGVFNIQNEVFKYIDKRSILKSSFTNSQIEWIFKDLSSTYYHMIDRCYNPDNPNYKTYGGKGIKVCSLWYNPYDDLKYGNKQEKLRFITWCIDNGFPYILGAQIDRIDGNGDYNPCNCQIVDAKYNGIFKGDSLIIHLHFSGNINIYNSESGWGRYLNNDIHLQDRVYLYYKDNKDKDELYREYFNSCFKNRDEFREWITDPNNDQGRLIMFSEYIVNNMDNELRRYIHNMMITRGLNPNIQIFNSTRTKPSYKDWTNPNITIIL